MSDDNDTGITAVSSSVSSNQANCPNTDEKVLIAKGNAIVIYVTAIVLFLIVAGLGMYLLHKSTKSLYERATDDIGLKNIGEVVKTMITTNADMTREIISSLSFKVYPSMCPAFFLLADGKGNISLDTSSTSLSISSLDMKKLASNGFIYIPNHALGTLAAYVCKIEKLDMFLLTCRAVSST